MAAEAPTPAMGAPAVMFAVCGCFLFLLFCHLMSEVARLITKHCLQHCPQFLQRVSIACYAKRCISYRKSVRLSVRPSVRLSDAGTVSKRLQL